MTPKLSIVVPAYNEGVRLPDTLSRIRHYLNARGGTFEVVVVDDGSTDQTLELAREAGKAFPQLKVLSNGRNRGKGYSVRHGFLHATGDMVLVTDADLSAPIEEVEKLERALEHFDGAIGSRALAESDIFRHQSIFRELSGKCFNLMVRTLTGLTFHDTQCGFKLFRREAFVPVFEAQTIEGFTFDVEVLYLALQRKLKVVELPVRWGHVTGSRVRVFPDAFRMFAELVRIRWRHR